MHDLWSPVPDILWIAGTRTDPPYSRSSPCEFCSRTFSTRYTLKRHLRDMSCSQPLPPEPKWQRVCVHEEDPDDLIEPPPQHVHGCKSCGSRFPTYGGLQEHLLTHRTVCCMCNRAFTRRVNILKHKCVTAGDHSCESCRRTFIIRHTLKRHLRYTSFSQPLPPEPKW